MHREGRRFRKEVKEGRKLKKKIKEKRKEERRGWGGGEKD